jgi:undecaprenyl-diphosphatase
MPILHAIILGIVQGLSEFLPISSSGHLILTRWFLGWDEQTAEIDKAFDVALHIGTLVAVVLYFRHDIVVYVREGLRLIWNRERPIDNEGRVAWLLVVATIPAAAAGYLFEDWIDERLGTPTIIAISLIGFGALLWWADRATGKRTMDELTARDALLVGAAQALALNPGTSRSGITMTAARQIGYGRDAAVRLSFLMSLPVIAGAAVVKVGGLVADGVPEGLITPMIVGVITSFLAGLTAVWGTLRLVRARTFTSFVIYRMALGVVVLVVAGAGWR